MIQNYEEICESRRKLKKKLIITARLWQGCTAAWICGQNWHIHESIRIHEWNIFMNNLFMNTQFMNIFQKKNGNENENEINIHEYKHSATTNRKSFGALIL